MSFPDVRVFAVFLESFFVVFFAADFFTVFFFAVLRAPLFVRRVVFFATRFTPFFVRAPLFTVRFFTAGRRAFFACFFFVAIMKTECNEN